MTDWLVVRGVRLLKVLLFLSPLFVCLPERLSAQQGGAPPFEGAVAIEPREPREQLQQPGLEGFEGILFGIHRLLALGLAPLVELGVENGLLGAGSGSIQGFTIAPGSLGSGSGVGLTVGYVFYSAPVWGGASLGASLKGYMEHSAFLGLRNLSGSQYLRLTGTYDLDTQDEFAGLGMDVPDPDDFDEEDFLTDYRQEEIRLIGDGQLPLGDVFRVGLRSGYRKNSLLDGKNDDLVDTELAFFDSILPGIGILPGLIEAERRYFQGGGFLAFDARNDARNPDRGALIAVSFDAFRGLDETPLDWNRFAGEFAGYLPLPDETRVIAARLLAVHQEPLHDAPLVPYYYLANLGGSSLLRSFSSFRFQDNDLAYAGLEFRRRVWTEEEGQAALDASLFAESAGVYRDIGDDLSLGDMEQSYGTELRLLVPNDVVARLGVATGSDGVKFYVGGGGRF